jgi:hypothetical protein
MTTLLISRKQQQRHCARSAQKSNAPASFSAQRNTPRPGSAMTSVSPTTPTTTLVLSFRFLLWFSFANKAQVSLFNAYPYPPSHQIDLDQGLILTTAACGGLRSTPNCRPRRALLHLSYSYASPYGRAILVTHGQLRKLSQSALTSLIPLSMRSGPP